VDVLFDQVSSSSNYIEQGKVDALAVSSAVRWKSLPNVPTFVESGMSGFVITNFTGLVAPQGTPADVLDKLNKAANAALQDEAVKKSFFHASIDFESLDITKPSSDETNRSLFDKITSYNLFIFSYVVIENATKLLESDFIFLKHVFEASKVGDIFYFIDSSFKLYDAIEGIARESWGTQGFIVLRPINRNFGNLLVLIRKHELEMVHERKGETGEEVVL
jgi:disulfide oxidoreductase YuzD